MTTRKLLICSIMAIAAVAGWLAFVPFMAGPIPPRLLSQVSLSYHANSPQESGQWARRDPPPLAEMESGETDDSEDLSGREKTSEASSRCLPDCYRHAPLTAACQPKLLTTLNALRVRLQI